MGGKIAVHVHILDEAEAALLDYQGFKHGGEYKCKCDPETAQKGTTRSFKEAAVNFLNAWRTKPQIHHITDKCY